jgi:glyoxylase-like metal-dependent hydrolase (beta-lactamase superfamily II)
MAEIIDVFALPIEKQFMKRLIKPDTWILNGFVEDCAAPHPHVVIGNELAAVIDTTDLYYDVRKYVETCVTDKPLIVCSTHSHFDHTGNNYLFEDRSIYMSQIAWEEVQENRIKKPEWAKGTYVPKIVKDGDVIDLGERQLECIDFCGCHSPSSIVYLDSKYGCLFTGDEFEGGQVLIGGMPGVKSNSCVELYHDNLLKLKKRVQGRFTCICPPHNGSPLDPLTLDNMIENCERILSGHEGMTDVGSMSFGLNPQSYHDVPFKTTGIHDSSARLSRNAGISRRSEWKGTSIVYNCNRVFYRDADKQ